ncbi:recombinase family protein, partial [Azorhizobium caulinodans]|uniref:recombinase family protein n=1 Tax=Azorhizobium caulinodans TaxID=7 RepID=UPI002FBE586B
MTGYARVSTDGQTLDSQIELLRTTGCERIFSETASGAKTERRELRKCIAALKPSDVLVVARLDR